MKLTEQRLKQIIKEEAIKKLLEQEDDDEFEDYKKMSRRDLLKKLAKGGLAAATTGALGGYLQSQADDISDQSRAARAERAQEYEQYKQTPQYALDEVDSMLSRPILFSWSWGKDSGSMQSDDQEDPSKVSFPENFPLLLDKRYGTIGVLSPEYGVVRKFQNDIKRQIQAGITQLEPMIDSVQSSDGSTEEWTRGFPFIYELPRQPNFANPETGILDTAMKNGFMADVGVSAHYDGMVYLPYSEIPSDMSMPNSEATPSEYYMQLWNQYFPGKE
tara:strand:- start:436 stop:1257 length:822 start_codon:yes stop_codon:yes gene_type:complete